MKKIVLHLIFFLTSTTLVLGQWTQKNNFPGEARTAAVSFVIGNDAYVGTGQNSNNAPLGDFWKYNAISDTWTSIADFPGAKRQGAIAFSINGKGYIGLGSDRSQQSTAAVYYSDFWMYDPATDQWSQIASFPNPKPSDPSNNNGRKDAIAFVINGKAYVGMGQQTFTSEPVIFSDLREYDPITGQWVDKKSDKYFGGASAISFVIDTIGYFGSGVYRNGPGANGTSDKDDLLFYSLQGNQWDQKAEGVPLLKRRGATAFVVNGKAYIGGGSSNKDFIVYDPIENTFTDTVTFITETEEYRAQMVSFVINGTAYAGLGRSNNGVNNDIWAIKLAEPSPAPVLTSSTATSRSLQLLWSSEAGRYTSFTLERSTDGTQFTAIASFDATVSQYTDAGLTENTLYYYRLSGVKANNSIEISNTIFASTRIHTPQSFAVIPEGNKAKLYWINESAFATSFTIECATDDVSFKKIAEVTGDNMPFVHDEYPWGLHRSYRIKANSNRLSSLYSDTVSTNLTETPALSAPSDVTTSYQDSIKLTWQHEDPYTTHFLVERSQDKATGYQRVDSVSRSFPDSLFLSFDNTVEEATQYHYKITAQTLYVPALTACSDTVMITTPLFSPTALLVSLQDSVLSLSWQDNSNKETKYVIERSMSQDSILSDNGSYALIDSVVSDVILYKDTVTLQDSYYHYRIKAINDVLASDYAYGKIKVTVKREENGGGESGNGEGGSGEGEEGENGGEGEGPVTALPQEVEKAAITAYPNPSARHLLIKAPVQIKSVVLYNSNGVVLKSVTDQTLLNATEVSLDVSAFTQGVYIVQVQTTDGIAIQRIIKK